MSFNKQIKDKGQRTKKKMTFSWKELACHGLLKELEDPSLVKHLLKVVMKERRDHVDEEAREYHSEITKENLLYILTMTIPSRCGKLRDNLLERYFAGEFGNSIRIHRDVTDELLASWQERKPYRRRDAIWTALLGGWEEQLADLNVIIDDPPVPEMEETAVSLYVDNSFFRRKSDWFQGIHEGRYYLLWHKDSFKEASHFTHWSVTASIDINVIEGRTEENPWGSQRYPDICWDPKYLRENPKERKHIDEMFC
jgi:hypothetical protein